MAVTRLALVGVAATVLLALALAQADRGEATPDLGSPATDEQVRTFEDLLRLDERIVFEAMVTGDVSRFATIYYNDPSVKLNSEFHAQLASVGSRVDEITAQLKDGPISAGRGYLTAQIAGIMLRQDNVAAWESVQQRADDEGRPPSAANMPNGAVPYEPKFAKRWIDVPFYVYDVFVNDRHATATLSYAPPEDADSAFIYHFTNVAGRWFISGADGGHVAAPIKPRTTPYVTRSATE